MKNEEELKKTLVHIIRYFYNSDIDGEILVWNRILDKYTNFEGGELIKNKVYNLLKMVNEAKQTSKEEYQRIMKMDIEEELWYIV